MAAARTGGLRDGEMRQVSAGGTYVLLARVGGKYHAERQVPPDAE